MYLILMLGFKKGSNYSLPHPVSFSSLLGIVNNSDACDLNAAKQPWTY